MAIKNPLKLLLSIKRSIFRKDDNASHKADQAFRAKRQNILTQQGYTCQGCGYISKASAPGSAGPAHKCHFDVHHRDDNHANNEDSNLATACHMCHSYQHVGHTGLTRLNKQDGLYISEAEMYGDKTSIASMPELSAVDFNLLQRAIGFAMLDEKESLIAQGIYEAFAQRANYVEEEFGSMKPSDFAAALGRLPEESYTSREASISDLRLCFNSDSLKEFGQEFMRDYPSLPISNWASVFSVNKNRYLNAETSIANASGAAH